MALFQVCKLFAGSLRGTKKQLVQYCLLISLLLYFLRSHLSTRSEVRDALEGSMQQQQRLPLETSWGAPLVWGDSESSAQRRAKFTHRSVRTGLMTLAVGPYAHFLTRFLSSTELYFLPGNTVVYYILTDSPRALDPLPPLGLGRELRVLPVSEAPGWERLAQHRMALLAAAIKEHAQKEVAYVYCMDVDQELVAPVGDEILGRLVATLHPELYGKTREEFPYERKASSLAVVKEDEGDYYYTSELYGGTCTAVHAMARACAQLILQDREKGVTALGLEESYLNRYLIDHRPTCVLSPEYSWWDSVLSVNVPRQRVLSLGRRCDAMEPKERQGQGC
ncbi:hypothetical protein DPEC_G00197090 [Dallia pectoralis]|uniref:Uncharacterized protein n=1 Tax=Dallia pectoralis TaxID=75939 RepID=A0ACC2G7X3_DALPE|nr:hypothetical protein DPEC_G00197090 [Dallia pectoralis]